MTLLQELSDTWPPAEDPPTGGYVRPPLAAMRPVAATRLGGAADEGLAVVVTRDALDRLSLAPLAREGAGWRRARPRDGTSAALVAALARDTTLDEGFDLDRLRSPGELQGERAIGVDQTNESLVVGGQAVVKWLAEPVLRAPDSPDLAAHLVAVGFRDMAPPIGRLRWTEHGQVATLVQVHGWLPDASDGWDWCVADVLAHVTHLAEASANGPRSGRAPCPDACPGQSLGTRLGMLAGALHAALATPSVALPRPVAHAERARIGMWHATAVEALERTQVTVDGAAAAALRPRIGALRARIDTLATIDATPVLRIHGDLHVGQILRIGERLAVIDLDDDVSSPIEERGLPLPAARDVAQLASSLDHVGRIVDRRTDGRLTPVIDAWIDQARQSYLAAYVETLTRAGHRTLLDERLLIAFEAERVCREMLYAAGTLPRWMYAPIGTLRRMIPR